MAPAPGARSFAAMTRILLITAMALVLAAPAHAGDGRLTKAQYQAQISAGNQRVTEVTAPFESARHMTRAQLASNLYAWERAERSGAARLTGIRPPRAAEHANRLLVRGSRHLAATLRTLRAEAHTLSRAAFTKAFGREMAHSRGPGELDRAVAELRALGYTDLD
jgi:hypothetical protein